MYLEQRLQALFFYVYMDTQEAIKGGATPNQGHLQSYIQNFTQEAIDCLVEIMRTSRNESLKLGAAKTIIDKSIADKKAVEVGGLNGEPIKFTILGGADVDAYISRSAAIISTSTGSTIQGSNEIQDPSVAPQGSQDNNSNNPISEVGTN